MIAKNTIFGIGLPKTGTTSLGDALECAGLSRFGWQPDLSPTLTLKVISGDFDSLRPVIETHEAFEDLPWPPAYEWLAKNYPDAKFILTTRLDHQQWLKSISHHLRRIPPWLAVKDIFGAYYADEDPDAFLRTYNTHNSAVRQFFAESPNRFLEIAIEDSECINKLRIFTGLNSLPDNFPHSNRTPKA